MPLSIKFNDLNDIWDYERDEFINAKGCEITLEHSLVSIEKWESKWKKPFLTIFDKKEITNEELVDYFKCMTLEKNVDPNLYRFMTKSNLIKILQYMNDEHSATKIYDIKTQQSGIKKDKIITSELIYYWMIANNIPFECKKWHINRLMMLINVCSIKNSPSKENKMSSADTADYYRELNRKRKEELRKKKELHGV